ncbi:MAG: hypothetical protein K2X28_06420 [Alphaproteobacteria bacterium]|nr:hypothetical protein [Alphaproteobacteria bacterium]
MKYFKSFLLASVFSWALIPASLSALTPDELADHIRNSRSCPVASIVRQEPAAERGWFSSFRQKTGNALRWFGDKLRTEEDSRTAAGHVSQMTKDGAAAALSYKTGFSFTRDIFNPIGNALRTVGQWIKGGEETQTTTRVVLNNLGLNKSSKDADVAEALRKAAEASLKADAATAVKTYEDVVLGLNKRGLSTKSLDTEQTYLSALAGQTLVKNSNVSYETFSQEMFIHGMPVLEKMNGIKDAADGEKLDLMNTYLRQVFQTESAKIKFDAARLAAAPAA